MPEVRAAFVTAQDSKLLVVYDKSTERPALEATLAELATLKGIKEISIVPDSHTRQLIIAVYFQRAAAVAAICARIKRIVKPQLPYSIVEWRHTLDICSCNVVDHRQPEYVFVMGFEPADDVQFRLNCLAEIQKMPAGELLSKPGSTDNVAQALVDMLSKLGAHCSVIHVSVIRTPRRCVHP